MKPIVYYGILPSISNRYHQIWPNRYFCHEKLLKKILLLIALIVSESPHSLATSPKIVKFPKSQTVRSGTVVTFFCQVTGDPTPLVRWQKGGENLPNVQTQIDTFSLSDVYVLRIDPVEANRDENFYECIANSGAGDPVRATANLTVLTAEQIPEGFPNVTDLGESQIVGQGNTAILNCPASGKEPLTFHWMKDSFPITFNNDSFAIASDGGKILRIENTTKRHDGYYECVVENDLGSETSQSVRLYVKAKGPLAISRSLLDLYEVTPGADLNLICSIVGSPKFTILWKQGGKDLTKGNANSFGKNILRLKNINKPSIFTCVARSSVEVITKTVTVEIQSPSNTFTKIGIVGVYATSVSLIWDYEPDEPNEINHYVIRYKPDFFNGDYYQIDKVHNNYQTISSLSPNTKYEFSVMAVTKNRSGILSTPVKATTEDALESLDKILYKITYNITPQDTYVIPENSMKFYCGGTIEAENGFQLVLKWLMNGVVPTDRYIENREISFLPKEQNGREKINFTSSLSINNITEQDAGVFSCVINTPYHNASVSAELTVISINLWHCSKEYSAPPNSNIQSRCNNALSPYVKSILLENLNASVVLQRLDTLLNDTKYNRYNYSASYYTVKKVMMARNLISKVEKTTTYSDWIAINDKFVNLFNQILTNHYQRTPSETPEGQDVAKQLFAILFHATLTMTYNIPVILENNTGSFYHSNHKGSVDSQPIIISVGPMSENKLDVFVSDRDTPYETSISSTSVNAIKLNSKKSNSLKSMRYVVTMVKPPYFENIFNNSNSDENDGHIYDNLNINGKFVFLQTTDKFNLDQIKKIVRIKFAHRVSAVYNPAKIFRRKLHFGEIKKAILGTSVCAHLNSREWSTKGCKALNSNQHFTICECRSNNSDLAFSVLTSFHEYLGKYLGLKILTWIVYPLSIVCVLLSLSSFVLDKPGFSSEKTITLHLCVLLLCGIVLLILGDKDNLHLPEAICTVFGVLSHFTWLSTFCWMAVEGIDLYAQIIKSITHTTRHIFKIYCAIGYGIPFLAVWLTLTIGYLTEGYYIYVGEMFCWLQDNYVWGFGVPAIFMALVNLIFALRSSFGIVNMPDVPVTSDSVTTASKRKESYRKRIIESVTLTVIFVVTWISGTIGMTDYQNHALWSYIFTILTSSQGIFIFIFRCPRNKKNRKGISIWLTEAVSTLFKDKENDERSIEMKEIYNMLNGCTSQQATDSQNGESTFDPALNIFDEKYEIEKHSFIIDKKFVLGKGEFGEVCKGTLHGIEGSVAFKSARPSDSTTTYLKALVSEVKILMHVGPHENVVSLLGVYRREIYSGIFYVALEFCEFGSLKSFLSKNKYSFLQCPVLSSKPNASLSLENLAVVNRNQPTDNPLFPCSIASLLKWSAQIANAMEYLGTKNVVHSDLAARNVLLNSKGDAKVTDFGLSRRTSRYSEYKYIKTAKDPLPWRWLAFESLQSNIFSCKSDVWSYGIILWEIYSLGRLPYSGLEHTMDFVDKLQKGLKNPQPKYASDEIYNIMRRCWELQPDKRPTFSSMKKIFDHAVGKGLDNISDMVLTEEDLKDVVLELAMADYVQT